MPLPPLPKLTLRIVEDRSPDDGPGFLTLKRQQLSVCRPGEPPSEPFAYDSVHRKALDAVVVAAHYRNAEGRRHVYLRTAIRPPVHLRPVDQRPLPEKDTLGVLWELVAGLVEPEECNAEGLLLCAARELKEELGFAVSPTRIQDLGPATFPSGGVIGERHHFFHVEVDPSTRAEPGEDGSVLERAALIAAVALDEALDLCRQGVIEDGKTELGLRRLMER
jgi:ADP-ribose pyrophosphatase